MARVLLRNVTKKYGDTVAVKELTLLVRDGEFLVLVGPSGCGKTSVLRMVAGLEKVTSGEIMIGDRVVNNLEPHERNVAMVFESPTYGLYPHLTAYDNMAFGLRLRKRLPFKSSGGEESAPDALMNRSQKEKAIKERIDSVADRLNLGRLMHRKQGQLSSGHSQVLALGHSLVQQPDLFLMDDPLSQVDARNRGDHRVEMRRRHLANNITTIYVTHDQQDAVALGDRVAVMNEGTLQQVGTGQSLYAHPANSFVACFIGSPPMNILRVRIQAEEGDMFLHGAGCSVRVPPETARRLSSRAGGEVLLGLRPEAIRDPHYLPGHDPQWLVTGRVTAREYTGSDIYLHLAIANQEVTARLDERTNAWPPDNFTAAFDMDQMHAFDVTNGQTLL